MEEDKFCIKCGAKNGKMISKRVVAMTKIEWEQVNNKMGILFAASDKVLVCLDEKGEFWAKPYIP